MIIECRDRNWGVGDMVKNIHFHDSIKRILEGDPLKIEFSLFMEPKES